MAFLQIKSNNPKLSFLIMKNPDSGLSIKRYRLGTLFAYYTTKNNIVNENEYNIFFKDGDDEVSFKRNQDEQYEHNDYKRFNSPLFIQGGINNFLRHLLTDDNKTKEYDLIGFENEIVINQFYMFNPKYIDLLSKYYPNFELSYKELNKNNYQVTIKSNQETLRSLVNLTYVVSLFYYATNDRSVWLEESEIQKYVKIINNINAPYFIRYVIKSRIIQSPNKFNLVKSELETTSSYDKLEIFYGDTHTQRSEFIKSLLLDSVRDTNIIDIGCNDMSSYGFQLLKQINKYNSNGETLYHAIDINEECLNKINKKAEHRGYDNNLITYNSIENFIETYSNSINKYNIILSEVFEHIKLKDDTKIIQQMLDNFDGKLNKFIITTPNKDFNKFYLFNDDDKRLDEHVFEMNKREFIEYFDKLMKPYKNKYRYNFIDIGDIVNGITATQAVIIKQVDEK